MRFISALLALWRGGYCCPVLQGIHDITVLALERRLGTTGLLVGNLVRYGSYEYGTALFVSLVLRRLVECRVPCARSFSFFLGALINY